MLSAHVQEEQVFQLREAEPMALINKQTNARIRSTAEMPVPQKHLNQDWARALVVSGYPEELSINAIATFKSLQSLPFHLRVRQNVLAQKT